jgi:hypothetical protein
MAVLKVATGRYNCRSMKYLFIIFSVLAAPMLSHGADECSEYKVGETRKLEHHTALGVLLPIPPISYSTTRLSEDLYRFSINPVFMMPAKDPYKSLTTPETYKEDPTIRQQIEDCFAWFNQNYGDLLSPRVRLAVGTEANRVYIKINKDSEFRSHSIVYAEKALKSCGTVVHESLHLMGLWDEYTETDTAWYQPGAAKDKKRWDCRAKSDSIMSRAFGFDSLPWHRTQNLLCGCTEAQGSCTEKLEKDWQESVTSCPEGTTELARASALGDPFFDRVDGIASQVNVDKRPVNGVLYKMAKILSDRVLDLPLRPAHLRQLIHPGCEAGNGVYRQCIRYAYKTSNLKLQCPDVPPECHQLNTWLE